MDIIEKTKKFHEKKKQIRPTIIGVVDNNDVIHGEFAISKQLPAKLKRETKDIDVFSDNPKLDARQAERRLDKKFGGDYFFVAPGFHKNTIKVKSKINQETYADFTKKPKQRIPARRIENKNYATLDYFKKHIKETLRKKESEYRRGKDLDALRRIQAAEREKKKKKKRSSNQIQIGFKPW